MNKTRRPKPRGQSPSHREAPAFYLASRSPRRLSLLAEHGFRAAVVESGIDDAVLVKGEGVSVAQWTAALAYLKARAARERLLARDPDAQGRVLGADTVVEWNGRVIGQPRDEADARRILHDLNDKAHRVVTGVALVDAASGRYDLFADAATVRVSRIPDAAIEEYVATGEWRGKAGAYNLSERIAAGWPIEYEGDPGTIMGLPMRRLTQHLERVWNVRPSRKRDEPPRH